MGHCTIALMLESLHDHCERLYRAGCPLSCGAEVEELPERAPRLTRPTSRAFAGALSTVSGAPATVAGDFDYSRVGGREGVRLAKGYRGPAGGDRRCALSKSCHD
jgi:hypothetical protein